MMRRALIAAVPIVLIGALLALVLYSPGDDATEQRLEERAVAADRGRVHDRAARRGEPPGEVTSDVVSTQPKRTEALTFVGLRRPVEAGERSSAALASTQRDEAAARREAGESSALPASRSAGAATAVGSEPNTRADTDTRGPGGALDVEVRDRRTRAALRGVRVEAAWEHEVLAGGTTDSRGAAKLTATRSGPGGVAIVRAAHPDYTRAWRRVVLDPERRVKLTLHLDAAGRMTGRVTVDGAVTGNATVRVYDKARLREVFPTRPMPPVLTEARSDDVGRYVVTGLPPRRELVAVVSAPGTTAVAFAVHTGLDPERLFERDVVLKPASDVQVRVVDEDGEPVRGARVYAVPPAAVERHRALLEGEGEDGSNDEIHEIAVASALTTDTQATAGLALVAGRGTTDADGRTTLAHVPNGSELMAVDDRGRHSDARPEGSGTVGLELRPLIRTWLRLEDEGLTLDRNVVVHDPWWRAALPSKPRVVKGEDGQGEGGWRGPFVVSAGAGLLRVEGPQGSGRVSWFATESQRIRLQERQGRHGRVEGTVVHEFTGEPISGAVVTIDVVQQQTNAQGEFRFRHVPVEPKLIHVSAAGYAPRELMFAASQIRRGKITLELVRLRDIAIDVAWPKPHAPPPWCEVRFVRDTRVDHRYVVAPGQGPMLLESVPRGVSRVIVSAPGCLAERRLLDVENGTAAVKVLPAPRVRVTVVDSGAVAAGRPVSIRPRDVPGDPESTFADESSFPPAQFARTDERGVLEFVPRSASSTVVVWLSDGTAAQHDIARRSGDADGRVETGRIDVPGRVPVVVRCVNADGSPHTPAHRLLAEWYRFGDSSVRVYASSEWVDGAARLRVPRGSFVLIVRDVNRTTRRIRIPADRAAGGAITVDAR